MNEMDMLAAPKKIVDGLTEVFQGFAQMFEGVSEQLELLAACAEPEEELAGMPIAALPPDKPVPVDASVKGDALPHPRKKPMKRGRKPAPDADLSTEIEPEDTSPDPAVEEGKTEDVESNEAEDTPGSDDPVDTAEALPWEDTGQKAKEPPDTTNQPDKANASDKPAESTPPKSKVPTLTKDDITSVIVAKIKQKRSNNEKIGQLLKAYGVGALSDLPEEKYEAFLTDISQL